MTGRGAARDNRVIVNLLRVGSGQRKFHRADRSWVSTECRYRTLLGRGVAGSDSAS